MESSPDSRGVAAGVPQGLKPASFAMFHGTTEVVPFPFLSLWSASGVSNIRFLDSAVPFTSLRGRLRSE